MIQADYPELAVVVRHADGKEDEFVYGDFIELKRKNGKRLKNCRIEDVF